MDWIPEDWDSITSLVRGSDMMLKDATLDLIDNVEISKGRERMLMSLADGKPYRYLSEKIFPAVMRVDYRIEYTCKPLGAAESLQLLRSGKQRALRLNEFFAVAGCYPAGSPNTMTSLTLLPDFSRTVRKPTSMPLRLP